MTDNDFLIEIINTARYQLGSYLLHENRKDIIKACGFLFDAESMDDEDGFLDEAADHEDRIDELIRESLINREFLRYERIIRSSDKITETFIRMAILEYAKPKISTVWKMLGEKGLTVELAGRITFFWDDVITSSQDVLFDAEERLSQLFYELSETEGDRLRTPAKMDERLFGFLSGNDYPIPESRISVEIRFPKASTADYIVRQGCLKKVKDAYLQMDPSEHTVVQLMGKEGDGKRFLVYSAESGREKPIVCINYEILKISELEVSKQIVWYAYRECRFYDAIPVFYGLSYDLIDDRDGAEGFLALCINPYIGRVSRAYVLTEPEVEIGAYTHLPFIKIRVPELTREERLHLWEKMWEKYDIKSRLSLEVISTKYKLSVAQIIQGAERLSRLERAGATADDQIFSEICNSLMPSPSAGSIRRIDAKYTFDDIKLPKAQKKMLYDICNHIWQRHKVFDTWGLNRVYSYGTGVSAIFAGPPGTGKTMAAHVISTMLGLPLYRVDLSQVVDKYIGESEKKLEQIFNTAEQGNMILFFDEADSIFGKRSEVKESNDRYANTEVSYILQRIEAYEGIVILATNYRKNIDDAFMRRMRYVVEFNMPDASMRKEIWNSCITPEMPTDDLDIDFLAEKYELSGGNIKNVMLNAVFLAASEEIPLNMLHILASIRAERIKMGVMMIPQDFGKYKDAIAEYISQ